MKSFIKFVFILLYIFLFYLTYNYFGVIVIKYVRKILNLIQYNCSDWSYIISNFRSLDRGRLVSRIGIFLWSLLIFYVASKVTQTKLEKFYYIAKPFYHGFILSVILIVLDFFMAIKSEAILIEGLNLRLLNIISTILIYMFSMILTSISEELIYRGYMLNILSIYSNKSFSIFITSIFFGAIHYFYTGSIIYALSSFCAGLWLGYAFFLKNIWYCIGLHFGWNFAEAMLYSNYIFKLRILNSFLAGSRITPDQNGLISLFIITVAFFSILIFGKDLKG